MGGGKNRGLGKGLEALFGDSELDTKEISPSNSDEEKLEGISYIDINEIKPNTNQPRKYFDEEKLYELANSIKEHGLIQPIVLRLCEKGYEIVAGERRWRAARKAELKTVPCIVRELTDEQNMLLAIIENMQREDLNPIEEAEGLSQMINTFGLTQNEISQSVGKSRPYITNSLRLLKLPEEIQDLISTGKISMGHGRALAGISNQERQKELADYVMEHQVSVRQIESLIKGGNPIKKRPAKRGKDKNPNVRLVEEDLKTVLGTKVNLNQAGKKGKIEIEYYSTEELERLIELLKTVR
ncbi:MAG: ParB/RepB/Spo0J family partition protein [Anaerovoracaceae bacterium]